ncbi:hypothetical protein CSA56_08995 [candidate division KSB3 bacterium]|uniref:Uncharacterized protein n=1 Tax=candidate division KSB3 bacterium TaxID=2044937 RepID=A0A2G6KEC9_9BACT|nr:MAG: hypothetical protein CSA56_08995 [candidate division KSB3 bacterium]
MIKRLFFRVTCFVCAMLSLITQEGKTYQFSPTTLETRTVKTQYLPVVHVPLSRKVIQKKEYMLTPLWRELRLVPKAAKKTVKAQWITCLHTLSGNVGEKGPAYALIDSRIAGSPAYWRRFAELYPREAKRLFRQIISALSIGDLEKAATLLSDNAWLPISV